MKKSNLFFNFIQCKLEVELAVVEVKAKLKQKVMIKESKAQVVVAMIAVTMADLAATITVDLIAPTRVYT